MLGTLIAAVAILSPSEESKVIAASLFRNGYSLVLREIDVTATGDVKLSKIPQATIGTFWITSTMGVKISHVVKTTEESVGHHTAFDLEDMLKANLGRAVRLGLSGDDQATSRVVSGKLISLSGAVVVVQTEEGGVAINKITITSVSTPRSEISRNLPDTVNSYDVLKIHAVVDHPGKIYLLDIENGMGWVPSYTVELSDAKQLTLTAKATVVDNLANLNDIEVRFVNGFPNLPWLGTIEPLISGEVPGGIGYITFDPLDNSIVTNSLDKSPRAYSTAQPPSASLLPGIAAEDMFFYREPNVTLKKGDHAFYILFQTKSSYDDLYTLELPDWVNNNVEYVVSQSAPKVWHSIRFKNTSGQPLAPAMVTAIKGGQVMGQDFTPYASPGAEVQLSIAQAPDIQPEANEEELSRDRASLRISHDVAYDLITVKGTILLENLKRDPVRMKIGKSITGEVQGSEGAKIVKSAKRLQDVNANEHLEWQPEIGAGKKLTLTYTYRVYVKTGDHPSPTAD